MFIHTHVRKYSYLLVGNDTNATLYISIQLNTCVNRIHMCVRVCLFVYVCVCVCVHE